MPVGPALNLFLTLHLMVGLLLLCRMHPILASATCRHLSLPLLPSLFPLMRFSDGRCPWPQCPVTDNFLCKAYDGRACMGCIGNSLSHPMLGFSASLQEASVNVQISSLVRRTGVSSHV